MFEALSAFVSDPPRILQLDMLLRILIQALLFCASALFSGSETALFSLSKFDLQRIARKKEPNSDILNSLLEQPRRLIVSILCGNELINIAAAANMTAILVELVGLQTAAWLATVVMVPLILLLGEVTPKTLAVINPVWVSTRIVAPPLGRWVKFVAPLAFLVRVIADRITTYIVGPERAKDNILHVEDLTTLIQEGVDSGEISANERALVQNLIQAGATTVGEIMTPRVKLEFIDGGNSSDEIFQRIRAIGHPRVPVYLESEDNILGFLYVESFLDWSETKAESFELKDYLQPLLAVPKTREIDDMLNFFETNEARVALVVTEYGIVEGLVSINDITKYLLAGLYGEITEIEAGIKTVEGGFEVDGITPLSQLQQIASLDVSDPSMLTVAGYVLRHFGCVPKVGDQLSYQGLVFTVLDMQNMFISKVKVTPAGTESAATGESE